MTLKQIVEWAEKQGLKEDAPLLVVDEDGDLAEIHAIGVAEDSSYGAIMLEA